MKPTKRKFSFLIFGLALFAMSSSLTGCGEDPGLYKQEELSFESGKEVSKDKKELNLGADDSSEFGFWPPAFLPAPIFPYYLEPVPVAIPISPFQAITEWIHPMYAIGMFQPFWPNLLGP